jgi:peptidoglycan/xylan/chitin deacetylase (PgdA/CDA1 family)
VKLPNRLHNLLLAGYCGATMPYRLWANRHRFASGTVPMMVLFYHRIADDGATCCTHSNRLFQRQIRWLQKHCDLISLEEVQRRIRRGFNDRLAACITFDDGYSENCDRAIPFLIKENVPCTYFVSSWHVLEGRQFAHDAAIGAPGRPNTVEQLRWMAERGIDIGAHTRTHIDLGSVNDECKLYDEVVTCGEELQGVIGKPVRYFSCPFGMPPNLNPRAFEMAYEYGYEAVCSAYGSYNFPGDDSFHIRRIHADDMGRLRNWGTIDPRRLHPKYRFEYQLPDHPQRVSSVAPA